MATIDDLVTSGDLVELKYGLPENRPIKRRLLLTPAVRDWFQNVLFTLTPFDPDDLRPAMQVRTLSNIYLSGDEMIEDDDFKLMKPEDADVYEFRTPDVRLYGWFYRPSVFIAVTADTMENVHSEANIGLASNYRKQVADYRAATHLAPPSHTLGATSEDVLSF